MKEKDEVKIDEVDGTTTVTFGENGMTMAEIAKWLWPSDGAASFVGEMVCIRLPSDGFKETRSMINTFVKIADDPSVDMPIREQAFLKICTISDLLDGLDNN